MIEQNNLLKYYTSKKKSNYKTKQKNVHAVREFIIAKFQFAHVGKHVFNLPTSYHQDHVFFDIATKEIIIALL